MWSDQEEEFFRKPKYINQIPKATEGAKSKKKTKRELISKGSGCWTPQIRKPRLTAKENAQANNKISHLEVNTKEK